MNKYPSIELQLKHLKNKKNIKITDEEKVKKFLSSIPYEKSIKEIKPMLAEYSETSRIYPKIDWDDVENQYIDYSEESLQLLAKILKVENKIKSNLIYLLQNNEEYKNYIIEIPTFFNEKLDYFAQKYNIKKPDIKQYLLDEKFYIIVNSLGFKELIRMIFSKIYKSNRELYNELLVIIISENEELEKIANSKIRKETLNNLPLFAKELTFAECINENKHVYYTDILQMHKRKEDKINKIILDKLLSYFSNIKAEGKFTNSPEFKELRAEIIEILQINISNSKLGDFLYIGEKNIKQVIAEYKDTKVYDQQKLNEIIKCCSTSILLYSLSREKNAVNVKWSLFRLEGSRGHAYDYKKRVHSEVKNQNIKKYLEILADIRNSVAHGGTYIIPLFNNYDGDLRVAFAENNLDSKKVDKLKKAREYFRTVDRTSNVVK